MWHVKPVLSDLDLVEWYFGQALLEPEFHETVAHYTEMNDGQGPCLLDLIELALFHHTEFSNTARDTSLVDVASFDQLLIGVIMIANEWAANDKRKFRGIALWPDPVSGEARPVELIKWEGCDHVEDFGPNEKPDRFPHFASTGVIHSILVRQNFEDRKAVRETAALRSLERLTDKKSQN